MTYFKLRTTAAQRAATLAACVDGTRLDLERKRRERENPMSMADNTYGWHQRNVKRAQLVYDSAYGRIWTAAKTLGVFHDRITPRELRAMPEMAATFADVDDRRNKLTEAQELAIAGHCAHRCGHFGDKFEWYSERDARKWRRQAKGRNRG